MTANHHDQRTMAELGFLRVIFPSTFLLFYIQSETDSEHNDAASSISEERYPAFETLYENIYLGSK